MMLCEWCREVEATGEVDIVAGRRSKDANGKEIVTGRVTANVCGGCAARKRKLEASGQAERAERRHADQQNPAKRRGIR